MGGHCGCDDELKAWRQAGATQHRGAWGLAAALAVLGVIVAVGSVIIIRGGSENDTFAKARRDGAIRIGYAVEAPYAFLTPDGKVTGEAPEIARVIAARLGIPRIEWRLTEFGSLIEGLEARRFDVIAAGLFITPERSRRVTFSSPTFKVASGLLVRKGNPHRLHSYADILKHREVRIAALSGSVEEKRLLQLGLSADRLVRVPDAFSGRAFVSSGQADGLALSAPTIRWVALHKVAGLTEMAEPFADASPSSPPGSGLGAFAFRPEDRALRAAWDAELSKFIGSDEHRRLVSTFGFSAAELPDATPNGPLVSPR